MKQQPTQTMSAFFDREDVKALQEIQKRNPFDSAEHKAATAEMKRLADAIGASDYFK